MARFVKVATTDQVPVGEAKLIGIDEKQVALFNLDGAYYILDDTCPHQGGPLSEGFVEEGIVTCPWHGAKFNVKTGEVTGPPARSGVARYNVRVQGSDIEIELEG
ncbi:MAG: non-heme iron oxygenase ferredoxin subunit [candidate division NC10 bacterium]|nr:non-heme iron oxygenase ferredoxin subunit [candidate division NC10 bacterium]